MLNNIPNTKIIISNRYYEKYCDFFDRMKMRADAYSPDLQVIRNDILPNLEENIVFLMWIDETGFETDYNRESRAAVREILRSCLEITD